MLLHFKELVVSPETHPLGPGRSPIQKEKNNKQDHERRVVLEAHKKVLSSQLLLWTGLSYQWLLLELPCMKVSQ